MINNHFTMKRTEKAQQDNIVLIAYRLEELEKKVDAYIAANRTTNLVMSEWYPKFKKVLPIRKVAKLYQAEEAFQMRMINNLRKHPGQNPPQGSVFRDRDKDKK